jgi:hypothetical protein
MSTRINIWNGNSTISKSDETTDQNIPMVGGRSIPPITHRNGIDKLKIKVFKNGNLGIFDINDEPYNIGVTTASGGSSVPTNIFKNQTSLFVALGKREETVKRQAKQN